MRGISVKEKINQGKMFGGEHIEIVLTGDTFDECQVHALQYTSQNSKVFIPPFDHIKVIEGQGTVAKEIFEEQSHVDLIFVPIGVGGLRSSVTQVLQTYSPGTKIIGVEP